MRQALNNIVIGFDGLSQVGRDRLQEIAPGAEIRYVPEHPDSWTSLLDHAEVVFGWPDPVALAQSGVRFHQLPSSGYDQYCTPALQKKHSFTLSNARGVVARAVAEHAIALILAFNRNLRQHWADQQNALWRRAPHYAISKKQTLLVIGLGAIGEELLALGHAIGMRVIAANRTSRSIQGIDRVYTFSELDDALSQADHIVLTLAADSKAPPLINFERLKSVKPTAYLYNLARGCVVDESALLDALQKAHLAGAALDVFTTEPLPPSSPLWSAPHLLVTPHAAGRFAAENEALSSLFLENLNRYLHGRPLLNVVIGKDCQ